MILRQPLTGSIGITTNISMIYIMQLIGRLKLHFIQVFVFLRPQRVLFPLRTQLDHSQPHTSSQKQLQRLTSPALLFLRSLSLFVYVGALSFLFSRSLRQLGSRGRDYLYFTSIVISCILSPFPLIVASLKFLGLGIRWFQDFLGDMRSIGESVLILHSRFGSDELKSGQRVGDEIKVEEKEDSNKDEDENSS